ncbi:MAG: B12-binding domain-containing protein [Roseobacter sp.]
MTTSTPRQLSHALDFYQKSDENVRLMKAKLARMDVEHIVKEVLTRVQADALRNETSIDTPSRKKVERLCYSLISEDSTEGQRFIEDVYNDGASLGAIYLNYLAEAAVVLGEWWEEDEVSFSEVAIGTSRIYAVTRGLSHLFVPTHPVEVRSAVFVSTPGETHNLGVRMAADLFGQEGWDVDLLIGKPHEELVAEITAARYPIVGLSAAGVHSCAPLARLIIALRLSHPTAALVLSGQITQEAPDFVAHLDLDGVASDVPSALDLFDRLSKRAAIE